MLFFDCLGETRKKPEGSEIEVDPMTWITRMDQPQSWLINNSCSNRPFSHVLFVFPIQIDPFFCSLKRVHAGIFMLACALFNEQDKEQILLSTIA